MISTKRTLCLIALLLLGGATARAQSADSLSESEALPLWFGFSIGPSTSGGEAAGGLISTRKGRLILTARLSAVEIGRSASSGLFGPTRDLAGELALLAGYALPLGRGWQVAGGAGIAAVRAYRYEAGRCEPFLFGCISFDTRTHVSRVLAGLPIEIGLHGPVIGVFGLGVRFFANVNAGATLGGITLDLRVGPLR